jgi:hypothetical protein
MRGGACGAGLDGGGAASVSMRDASCGRIASRAAAAGVARVAALVGFAPTLDGHESLGGVWAMIA